MYVTRLLFIVVIIAGYVSCDDHLFYKRYSLTRYLKQISEAAPKHNLNVSFQYFVDDFVNDYEMNTLTTDGRISLNWTDHYLTWKPANHSDIKSIKLGVGEILMPEVYHVNRVREEGIPDVFLFGSCELSFNGSVVCHTTDSLDTLCNPNLEGFPFDTQICTIILRTMLDKDDKVGIKFVETTVTVEDIPPNAEWDIINTYIKEVENVYGASKQFPAIGISFVMKRKHGAHAASVVIPTLVLVILTFTSIIESPVSKERLLLCYVNLIAQTIHLQYLSWHIPLRGDHVPYIILFARHSLLLTVFNMVFTLIFKHFLERKSSAPQWISTIVSSFSGILGAVLNIEYTNKGNLSSNTNEDASETADNQLNTNSKDWEIFGKILDKTFFAIYVIIYSAMTIQGYTIFTKTIQ